MKNTVFNKYPKRLPKCFKIYTKNWNTNQQYTFYY